MKTSSLITDLEISKKSVIYEQERAEQYRKEAERLKNEVEAQRTKINEQKEKILSDARAEARMVYQQAKEESDRIIKEINKGKKPDKTSLTKNDRSLKEKYPLWTS